jgi:hypothetical protein
MRRTFCIARSLDEKVAKLLDVRHVRQFGPVSFAAA